MRISEKTQLSEKLTALKNFDGLKFRRDRIVYVGDHPDAERCKKLKKTRIILYTPSQRNVFPEGYIEFSWGRGWSGNKLFDLKFQTINGQPRFIFEPCDEIEMLFRKLSALVLLEAYGDAYQGVDLAAYLELVLCLSRHPGFQVHRDDRGARQQLWIHLRALSLVDLESLVEAARPSTGLVPPRFRLQKAG